MADVIFKDDGPILVVGDFVLKDAHDGEFDVAGRTTIGLCRCGASENKPFCDGAHKRSNFQSDIRARQLPPMK
ncbi:MAG: CDGSH iron-sulfur domain-containing protein [Acidobacteriota bacterium]|nr:CDGSH iron-sulfur domain-containing protein [Acidobacteriota bacterium]